MLIRCPERRPNSTRLLERPRIVVATKLDLSPEAETLAALRAVAEEDKVAYCELSALQEQGLEGFIEWVRERVAEVLRR